MPQSFKFLGLLSLLLIACGSPKDIAVSGTPEGPNLAENPQRVVEAPKQDPNKPVEGIQRERIACELNGNSLLLTTSLVEPQERNSSGFMAYELGDGYLRAPLVLDSRGNETLLLSSIEKSGYGDTRKNFFTRYRLVERTHESVLLTESPKANSSLLAEKEQLRLPEFRSFAVQESRKLFAIAAKENYSIRSLNDPTQELFSWNLAPGMFANPRWENSSVGELVFWDVVAKDGTLSQKFSRLKLDGSILETLPLPAPMIPGSGVRQLGARMLDQHSVVWMEWSKDRILLRSLDLRTLRADTYELPAGFAPAYAIYHDRALSTLFVLANREAVSFFRFSGGKLVREKKLELPHKVKKRIADSAVSVYERWEPTTVVSSRDGKTLTLSMPEEYGMHLFAIDEMSSFRRLTVWNCENPSLLTEILK